jgi:hypothetical protein
MSTDQQPDMPGQDEDKTESEPPPVTEIDVPEPKRVRSRLSDLRRQPTDEDNTKRAEELRRLEMIAKGQHPDTGKTLRPGDANSFRSATEKMQAQTYLLMRQADRLNPIPPHVRAIIDAQTSPLRDPARQAIDRLGLNQHALGARSVIDDLAVRDPYSLAGVRSLPDEARAAFLGLETMLNSASARLDPINDPALISRLVDRVDPSLLHRATALAEPYAMQAIREHVNAAAAHRIIDTWLDTNSIGMAPASVAGFVRDHARMASEANRMLGIYGPAIAEQTAFLRQYETNLSLFRSAAMLTPSAFERADLLARIVLPGPRIWDDALYQDAFNPRRLRGYGKALLKDLKAHYKHTKNPFHAWEAIATARAYSVRMPKWVLEYLGRVAVDIVKPEGDEVTETPRKKKESEAERIGKIAGFSGGGRGQTGMFKKAITWKRDHAIYRDMLDQIEAGVKEDFAYNIVAQEHGISRSTVVKAFVRMRRYLEAADDQGDDDGGDPEVS